jgi:hypothetical protein
MDPKGLEERIQRLEDIEAIKRLKYQYCAYCDDNYNPDGIASLHAEDAVFDGGEVLGKIEGREALRAFFCEVPKVWRFAAHQVMNPIVDVQGNKATGVWKLFQPCNVATKKGIQPLWVAAIYNDEYEKVGGQWRFKHVAVNILFMTPFEKGWVKKPFVDL